jgi:uncharacterized protein (TIGR02147 family)
MTVFEFRDYKEFVSRRITDNNNVRGYRSQLAAAAGCQLSFMSQVVHGSVHLTPEHALGMAFFWGLPPLERAYFVELVNYARAGTAELRAFLQKRLDELLESQEKLSRRFDVATISDQEKARKYYSIWYYSAIHVLTSIPEFQIAEKIAERLNLSENVVQSALLFLESMELVRNTHDRWEITESFVHVANNSWLSYFNHVNWRQRALADAANSEARHSVHYSAVCTVSKSDIPKLQAQMLAFLDAHRKIVSESPAEELIAVTCDLFEV